MSLSEEHTKAIVEYLRFMRYKRGQRLRAIDGCFTDLKDSRLNEDTFTADEVASMIDGLSAVVHADVETELIDSAHSNVIILRQLFTQAAQSQLTLRPDISQAEQKSLLEEIAQFERESFAAVPTSKLKSLSEMSAAPVSTGPSAKEKELESALAAARAEIEVLKRGAAAASSKGGQQQAAVEAELVSTKAQLTATQKDLASVLEDLDKKFQDTAQYTTMRKMLETKNQQLKDLRAQLGTQ
eukprot:m.60809 g.60809  ORF g.60809 m.60809 type:complete len:241 (-) comp7048_c0_seq1:114-836(-)